MKNRYAAAVVIGITATCTINSMFLLNKLRSKTNPTHQSNRAHQQYDARNFCSGYGNYFGNNSRNNICWGENNHFHTDSRGNLCWGKRNNVDGKNNWLIGNDFIVHGDNKTYLSRKATLVATLVIGIGAVLLKEALSSLSFWKQSS